MKIQWFFSGLNQAYKDRTEIFELRNIEEEIRKDNIAMSKEKINLITIRHGRKKRM